MDVGSAYQDFILAHQATRCSPRTIEFYQDNVLCWIDWMEQHHLEEITAKSIREYLASCTHLQNSSLRTRAKAIRACIRFMVSDGYVDKDIPTWMPRPESHRMLCLTLEELRRAIAATKSARDKAILLLLADSGLRRAEALSLTWGDLNFATGTVLVRRGKGNKTRTAIIRARTRRSLLTYRRTLGQVNPTSPLWIARDGSRLTSEGLRHILNTIGHRAGIHITPHALRRTFATLSLKGGMDVISLQRLMGHADVSMTAHYVQLLDVDLVAAHEAHGLDSWI